MLRHDFRDVLYAVRGELPREAFQPNGRELWDVTAHLLICAVAYACIRYSEEPMHWAVAAIVLGHSMFCMGLVAHTLAHRSVVRYRPLRYALELVTETASGVPATAWRIIHSFHHKFTNSLGEVHYARRFTRHERTLSRTFLQFLLLPNRHLPGNPLVFTFMGSYIWRNVVPLLLSRERGGQQLHAAPGEKALILFEVLLMVSYQVGLYYFLDGDVARYLAAGPVPLVFQNAWTSLYVQTQHFARAVTEEHDPLHGSQSVLVPRWVDLLHQNVSHHVEHHLFPGINPKYLPLVRKALVRRFPESFAVKGLFEAWADLWRCELYADDPVRPHARRDERDPSATVEVAQR